jgi:hypothetical protein
VALLRPFFVQDLKKYLGTNTRHVIRYAKMAGLTLYKYKGYYRPLSKREVRMILQAYRSAQGQVILNRIKRGR